ncbi:MAG TPA: O-antigen ligase family protein [bacterium]|nr:O-antigen ligase family protein [bacterium]HOL34686.1 O-antigen ligase family protein [bacterium]HPP07556.1 O-antigen ligase family protein [bacterium]
MKKNIESSHSGFYVNVLKFIIVTMIFLRPFFDGFSSPAFNHTYNLAFFTLLPVCIFVMKKNLTFTYPLLCFLIFTIMCLAFVPLWPAWTTTIKQFPYFFSLLTTWFLFKIVFEEKDISCVTSIFLCSMVLIMIYGIHQYFWGLEATRQTILQHPELIDNISDTYMDRIASNRIFSTFVYPNTFAGYLLMLYPVVFFYLFSQTSISLKILTGIVLITLLPVLAATESMGGWFCFIIVSILMLMYFVIPKKYYLYFCFFFFIILILLAYHGFTSGVMPKFGSLIDRINYWSSGMQIFKNHPFTGVGPGNFSQFYLRFKIPGAMEAKFAHNLIVEILVCTGLVGLVVFVTTAFFFIKENLHNFLFPKNQLIAGYIFGMTGFLLHSLIDFDYANVAVTCILFAFAGLVESYSGTQNIKSKTLTKSLAGIIIIVMPIALVLEYKTWQVENILENIKRGKSNNPIQVLEQASNIFPEPEIFFIEGEIFRFAYQETRNIEFAERAVDAYKKAIEMNPLVPLYHKMLARLFVELGKNDDAEKEFLQVINLYPSKALYNIEIGEFYKKIGNEKLAKIYLEKGLNLPASSKDEARTIKEYKDGKDF